MHDTNSQTESQPSMEATFPDGMSRCPEAIRELVTEICACSTAQPQTVLAVLLAVAASAMGPGVRVVGMPVMFSIAVSHDAPRRLPWFDVASAPLTRLGLDLQVRLGRDGAEHLHKQIAQRDQDLAAARNAVNPDPELLRQAQIEIDRLRCSLNPFAIIGRIEPKQIAYALAHSFDGGLTTVNVCADIVEAFLRLPVKDRLSVTENLNESWQASPLTGPAGAQLGQFVVIAQTRRPLRKIIEALDAGLLPPPLLAMSEHVTVGRVLPLLDWEPTWGRIIEFIFQQRLSRPGVEYRFTEKALEIMHAFVRENAAGLSSTPEPVRPWMEWLGELAPRIAAVVATLNGQPHFQIDEELAQAAVSITRWIGLAHGSAVEAALLPSTDITDRRATMLAKIRLKAPVTSRDLWRSHDRPKVSWFQPTLEGLIDEKMVTYDAEHRLIPAGEAPLGGAGSAGCDFFGQREGHVNSQQLTTC